MTVGMVYKVTLATGTGRSEQFDYEYIQPSICEDDREQAKEIARHYRADTSNARWRIVDVHMISQEECPNPLPEVTA